MKRILILIPIFILACTTVRNISPPPTTIPPSLSKDEAEYAIMLSLKDPPKPTNKSAGLEIADRILSYAFGEGYSRRQYWFYEGRGNDLIYAGFHFRHYYMRTEIRYDDKEITFKIVESRNLKQSKNRIHAKAMQWLGYLERNVRATLGAYDRYKYEQEKMSPKDRGNGSQIQYY